MGEDEMLLPSQGVRRCVGSGSDASPSGCVTLRGCQGMVPGRRLAEETKNRRAVAEAAHTTAGQMSRCRFEARIGRRRRRRRFRLRGRPSEERCVGTGRIGNKRRRHRGWHAGNQPRGMPRHDATTATAATTMAVVTTLGLLEPRGRAVGLFFSDAGAASGGMRNEAQQ